MPYAPGARFDLGKQCLSGTRAEILDKIYDWANAGDADAPRVLLLSGAAGSGKSAIAHTVASRFNELQRLGSSYFFVPGQRDRGPERLFSTITRDLADLDPAWRAALARVVGPRSLRKTGSVLEQFEEFILKPARGSALYFGPVVIVIDALDAAGDPGARQALVALLASRTAEVPRNFRILLTARPEPDIRDAFSRYAGVTVACWAMEEVLDRHADMQDISAFFCRELSAVEDWSERARKKLAAKSEGDWGWAVAACAYIKQMGISDDEQADRLAGVLASAKSTPSRQAAQEHPDGESSLTVLCEKLHLPRFGATTHEPCNIHDSHPALPSNHVSVHTDVPPTYRDGEPLFPKPVLFTPPSTGGGRCAHPPAACVPYY